MRRIIDVVNKIRVGEALSYRNLTVFPLFGVNANAAGYITLDEAIEKKCAVITEVSEGGSVPELKFVNSGKQRVFLLDGEELVGAKQNRILNLSILVPAGKTLIIPVSCVEAGRWSHRSRQFASAPRVHYAKGKAMYMAKVSASLHAAGGRRSDQAEIWRGISEKFAHFKRSSATSAMSDLYEQESEKLEEYVRPFAVLESQSGALFAIDGRVVGLDLFDSHETFQKLFPKLLRSYGLDALEQATREKSDAKTQCTSAEAHAFVERVSSAKAEEFPAIGEGTDLRLSGQSLIGAALIANDQLIHLSAFDQ